MKIPLYQAYQTELESVYVNDALKSGWISSKGKYIDILEAEFAQQFGYKHAITVNNGTSACHLALLANNIRKDDEVIVPDTTFIATANAVKYCNANPVFVDIDINTWNIDTKLIECVITQRTKAIFCVHLFGNMCNMDKLEDICKKHNIILIQDACQAIGSKYLAGKYQGFVGKNSTAAFSLFYSKTIQCGEGGIVVTDSDEVADKIRLYKGQGQTSTYWHSVVGYNYRMTNIQAAIALSQLRFFPAIKEKKTRVYNTYRNLLNHEQITFQKQEDKSSPLYWAVVIKLRNQRLCEAIKLALTANDIEFRPVFYPLHIMKPHRGGVYTGYPIVHDSRAAELHNTGIILPSYPDLSYQNIEYICNIIKSKL